MAVPRFIRELGELVWKRRLLVVGIALLLLLGAVVTTFLLPRRHVSATRVRIVSAEALQELYGVELGSPEATAELVKRLREDLLSQETAVRVVTEIGAEEVNEALGDSPEQSARKALIEDVMSSTTVDVVVDEPEQVVLRIAYHSVDPHLAQRIVTRLATGLRARIAPRQDPAEEVALRKARGLVTDLRNRLAAVEAEAAAFAKERGPLDPTLTETTEAALRTEQGQAKALDSEAAGLRVRLGSIRAQREDEPEWAKTPGMAERVRNPMWIELRKSETAIQEELAACEKKLAATRGRVAELERQCAEYPALLEKRDRLQAQREELRTGIATAEEEVSFAENDWFQAQAERTAIVDVMDAPPFPVRPEMPNQLMVACLGLVLGLGAGVGTVLVLDLFDDSIRSVDEVSRLLELPVLGGISPIVTDAERKKSRRKTRVSIVAVIGMLVLIGVALFVQVAADGDVGPLMARLLEWVG